MTEQPITKQDRRRHKGLIIFQILMYGYLIMMFSIQMYMYSQRNW